MMKKNNRKGFTLVEVLAVIAILGVLSTIGIVTVVNIRNRQEEEFNQTQRELFKQIAKTYFSDHKTQLPLKQGDTNRIYLENLINDNYLDSLLDYNKESYSFDSYVEVQKIGENDYYYDEKLFPKGTTVSIEQDPDLNLGNISFGPYKKGRVEMVSYKSNRYTNQDAKVQVKMVDDDGIKTFYYSLYKNNKKIYDSEFIPLDGKTNISDILNLSINDYEDGIYQFEVFVFDTKGYKLSKKSDNIIIDTKKPTCSISIKGTSGENEWYTSNASLSLTAKDENPSGLEKHLTKSKTEPSTYDGTITVSQSDTEGVKWYGYVKDLAGNTGKCESKNIKVDTISPKITTFTANSSDSRFYSMNVELKVSIEERNQAKYDISNSTYSSNSYSSMAYIKTTTSLDWNLKSSYDGGTKKIYITVKDEAGNTSKKELSYTVYKECSNVYLTDYGFGSCSVSCGGGIQYKTIFKTDRYLYVSCGTYTSGQSCNTHSCCNGPTTTYTSWSPCNAPCDGGTQTRIKTVTYCDGTKTSTTESQSCNTHACCDGPTTTYTNWSPCNAPCGGGTQTRIKTVTYCDGTETNTMESQRCNTHDCCDGASTTYSNWSPCNAPCDGGTQTRTKTVTNCDGTETITTESQRCNTHACCTGPTVSYSKWSSCSKTCGGGTKTRTKTVKKCDGTKTSTTEKDSCNTQSCCSSVTTKYGDWSECKRRGSNRYPNKTRKVKTYSDYNDDLCSNETESKTCTVGRHTHNWNARGNSIFTDNAGWTCTVGHTNHNKHYNRYCSICGEKKSSPGAYVCPTKPYETTQGWVIVDD